MFRPTSRLAATLASTLLALPLCTASVQAGGTMTVTNLTGYDLVKIDPSGIDLYELVSEVNPSAPFAPMSFEECLANASGSLKSCLDGNATLFGLTPQGLFTNLRLQGVMSVAKPAALDSSLAQQSRDLFFTIAGTAIWDPYEFRVKASFTETLPGNAPVKAQLYKVNANGTTTLMQTYSVGEFDTLISLVDGNYRLSLSATASLVYGGSPTSGFLDYTVTVTPGDTTCGGPGAGDCLAARGVPNCDDLACCQTLCTTLDPSCCQIAWDASCVALAAENCLLGGPASGERIDPMSGRRYVLYGLAPRDFAFAALLQDGWTPGLVKDDRLHRWLQRSLAVPSSPFGGLVRIGLSDDASEGTFLWHDGEPLSYAAWTPGEPNDFKGSEDCVELRFNGGWYDSACSTNSPTLAEYLPPTCGTGGDPFEVHGPGCDDPVICSLVCQQDPACCTVAWDADCVWTALDLGDPVIEAGPFINPANRHRYWILGPSHVVLARRAAAALGGTLAIPNAQAEQDWMVNELPRFSNAYYIGINDELFEGSFRTELGLGLPFTQWANGEPNDYLASEDAVVMDFLHFDGKWNDLDGRTRQWSIVEANCLGDFNDDGAVTGADLSQLLGAWGTAGGDLTGDFQTDGADLSVLLGAWGDCPTG
jgi:hypothetical protein